MEKQELQARIILLEAFATDLKKKYRLSKEKLKEYQATQAEWKKKFLIPKLNKGNQRHRL
jgi:hypothetical protein